MRNPYDVLRIDRSASKAEIQEARRRQAQIIHPDRIDRKAKPKEWAYANDMLQEVNAAYDLLMKEGFSGHTQSSPPPRQSKTPPPRSTQSPPRQKPGMPPPKKLRDVYAFLGVTLGWLGIHNFYAGYGGRGWWQFLLGISGRGFSAGPWIAFLWALGDVVFIRKDSKGVPMHPFMILHPIRKLMGVCRRTSSLAWESFGCALIGSIGIFYPIYFALFLLAFLIGHRAQKRIRESQGQLYGLGLLKTGKALFFISLIACCVFQQPKEKPQSSVIAPTPTFTEKPIQQVQPEIDITENVAAIEANDQLIYGILRKWGMPEKAISQMKLAGGPARAPSFETNYIERIKTVAEAHDATGNPIYPSQVITTALADSNQLQALYRKSLRLEQIADAQGLTTPSRTEEVRRAYPVTP